MNSRFLLGSYVTLILGLIVGGIIVYEPYI